jgi:hypothetical protein
LYHKASGWGARVATIVGTSLGVDTTLWGLLEKQLTGKTVYLKGMTSPGKAALREFLETQQPVLILMDEILEYAVKAAGKRVEESTLAAQTLAFIHELSETAGSLERVSMTVTLPSSVIEHYDESAESLFQKLTQIAGREEKIYTPIEESEIAHIIRRRLFSSVDEDKARETVRELVEYSEEEGILPLGSTASEYRERFLSSYPFLPEVIGVLYHRWGSFATFQRTRGVLRLLSLVVHSMRKSSKPYISLSDFDLGNQEIRQELLKHIGSEYNSVIGSDVTDKLSGAKKVDGALGSAYQGLGLGTAAATTAFMYSFSGGQERGATLSEVKRAATTIENPAAVIAEAVEQLKSKLFYLQSTGDRLYFSNQPNLNRILLTQMENIADPDVIEEKKLLIKESLEGRRLKTLIWEEDPSRIPDSEDLRLIILQDEDREIMKGIIQTKGQTPRVYRNTIFFLYPHENERQSFRTALKRKLAYELIEESPSLRLTEEQKKDISRDLKKSLTAVGELLRRIYRLVGIPSKDGIQEIDLGVPTYGETANLDAWVYEKLRSEGLVLEKIAPLVIREKYLANKDSVETEAMYQSMLKTPGETRPVGRAVLEKGIQEGVQNGLFGLGTLEEGAPRCRAFKEIPAVALTSHEILISEKICLEQTKQTEKPTPIQSMQASGEIEIEPAPQKKEAGRTRVSFSFIVPKGKVAPLMGVMNYLQSRFETLSMDVRAEGGALTDQEYDDKVMEAFRQAGIECREE